MNLDAAMALVGDHGRYLSDVYSLYNFQKSHLLKDYLDFILHEPVAWLMGFPTKLSTPSGFAKPKTALIKLLKHTDVKTALGDEYVKKVHDCIWQTYKSHATEILAKRSSLCDLECLESDKISIESGRGPALEIIEDVDFSNSPISTIGNKWEYKYRILESTFRAYIKDRVEASAMLILLDALSSS